MSAGKSTKVIEWLREAYVRDCISLACFEASIDMALRGVDMTCLIEGDPWPRRASL